MANEVNYKVEFAQKYFNIKLCNFDVLRQVDLLIKDKKGNILLYIESKDIISSDTEHQKALAQVILTNKKQEQILNKVALIYKDKENNDYLELIDCSQNGIMFNNDINWAKEKASQPTKDAIDRINDRIKGNITQYINDEIAEFYKLLEAGASTQIDITGSNFISVYNEWKHNVIFKHEIQDEQDNINLFLVDILNGATYKIKIESEMFGEQEIELIREGTNLSKYRIMYADGKIDGIKYNGEKQTFYYEISNAEKYDFFWKKYKRPPAQSEFLQILEHSAKLYSEKYRKDTGGEYTPSCFVEKQNEILKEHYNLDDFIVFDPCAGVGNLQNQFGKDYKNSCYLSTLDQTDVDICKIKGFENSVQFDYLKDDKQPKFKYKGKELEITEIAKLENKKLMVIMNPPYQRIKGKKENLAILFFNKVLELNPQAIVFYYMTESFLRSEVKHYINSGYKILSHIFSNAKTTFLLSTWSISQVIFDKDKGETLDLNAIKADRYELNAKTDKLEFKRTYIYNDTRPNLINEIDKKIKENKDGLVLGNFSYLESVINLTNKPSKNANSITSNNLVWSLLSKGLNFNTHQQYFERSDYMFKGNIDDIPKELFNDAIAFSTFYVRVAFTNKGQKNYIMPFTSDDLGCAKNDLNVLMSANDDIFAGLSKPFDFRDFLKQFEFSNEAKNLFKSALKIFRYYHSNDEYKNKDFNDSFYDITNAIMGKDESSFKEFESQNDTRITKVKTTKGTKGFGRNTIKYAVKSEYLPIFIEFFDNRDILARKINRQLVESGLLLWERENIY